jgi:hypothetical protein
MVSDVSDRHPPELVRPQGASRTLSHVIVFEWGCTSQAAAGEGLHPLHGHGPHIPDHATPEEVAVALEQHGVDRDLCALFAREQIGEVVGALRLECDCRRAATRACACSPCPSFAGAWPRRQLSFGAWRVIALGSRPRYQ